MSPSRGRIAASERRHPPVAPPSFAYPFANGSALFKKIPSSGAPVHSNSAAILAAGWQPTNTGYTWLGPRRRGTYYQGDMSAFARAGVFVNWPSVCATVAKYSNVPFPAGWADIQHAMAGFSSDSVLVFIDTSTGDYYEAWTASGPGYPNLANPGSAPAGACSSSRWNAVIWNKWAASAFNPAAVAGDGVSPAGFGVSGASASDILIGNALLIPEDFDDLSLSSVIPHALQISGFLASNGSTYPKFVAPARAGDGKQAIGPPMGARIRLKQSIDVNNWPTLNSRFPNDPMNKAVKKICRTLQQYGCVCVDSTGAAGAGGIHAAMTESVQKEPGRTGYKFPWEASTSNVGWSYGNGLPYDLQDDSHWEIIDWNVWTGA
jgi:hypothetical protein